MQRMMILLALCLGISGCAPIGDFCDVVSGPLIFAPETSQQIVKTDRSDAVNIKVQNEYGMKNCPWGEGG